MKTQLIYCAGANRQYVQIALDSGWDYGARLPDLLYFDPVFADQDYEHPDYGKYMAALERVKPRLATVIDWQHETQLPEVLMWAESAAAHVQEAVIIIPKVHGGIARLPRTIGGKEVRLGYSVPTSYGGTEVFVGEFVGWHVHALGGSPKAQKELMRYLDVRSADSNYINRKIKHGQAFDGKRWRQLRDMGIHVTGDQVPTSVLTVSLPNIAKFLHYS